MSAKLIYSLTDENPDLQKQIGCMNGFFQLFDRHRYLAAGRVNSHGRRRLQPPPGQNGNQAAEPNNRLEKATTEKNSKKAVKEKRRSSTESPRISVSSSSCSSSFSSLDYNKTAHLEPSPISSHTFSTETPSRDLPVSHPNGSSTQLSRKSLDLRDVVKDSMHREARGLLVKTAAKEAVVHNLKYIDSPRPLEPTKSVKPRISSLNDSFRVFAKLQEKDGPTLCAPKDSRRLSYDGRESLDALKTAVKFKELPRLSLDSRQSCIKGSSISETRSSYLLNDSQLERRNSNEMANLQVEPGSSKRASSVVAKLMGLVDPMPTAEGSLRLHNTLESEKHDPLSRSSRTTKLTPQMKNVDSITKTTANQKFPIETAPWRQGNRSQQLPAFKSHEAPAKIPTATLTVYGEIEKRLGDLEFKKSGKDLRALKQILEAMQKTKEILDSKKDQKFLSQGSDNGSLDQSSNSGSQRNQQSNVSNTTTTPKVSRALKSYKSPIVIMKPVKLTRKDTDSASSMNSIDNLLDLRKHQTNDSADNRKLSVEKRTTKSSSPRSTQATTAFNRNHSSQDKNFNIRTAKSAQTSKMTQSDSEENSGSSGRSSGTMSPRLQQRRFGMDKQSPQASPDSSRSRRQCSRQAMEHSSSPGRKFRQRSSDMRRNNEQWSETRNNVRDLSQQGTAISLQYGSNISFASDIYNGVTSIIHSDQMNSIYFEKNSQKQKNPIGFSVNRTMADAGRAASEQPSPISVLDAAFYRDDSPSPVKKTSNAFKDDETPYPDEAEWRLMDVDQPPNSRKSSLSIEVDDKILENIKHQVRNPQEMSCKNVEPIIFDPAFLCDTTNPDHKYISDILSASDLLPKLETGWTKIQFHSSDHHLINPKLFFALENLKPSARHSCDEHEKEKVLQPNSDEGVHRRLVFDVVNEILDRKLVVTDSFTQWVSPDKLMGKKPRGQQLLRELCSEVDRLKGNNNLSSSLDNNEDIFKIILCEDMMHWPMNWTEYDREIPSVVLDVERLIFKDLITELICGEAAGLPGRPAPHRRQLFPN